MGRLIDADKLKEVMSAAKDIHGNVAESFINNGGELSTEWYCVDDMVDNAETVEAIPVDWLLRKADWCDKNNGIFVGGAIRSAVDAWKEEQSGD